MPIKLYHRDIYLNEWSTLQCTIDPILLTQSIEEKRINKRIINKRICYRLTATVVNNQLTSANAVCLKHTLDQIVVEQSKNLKPDRIICI